MLLRRLHKLQVHRTHRFHVLLDHRVGAPAPFVHVAGQAPDQAHVVRRVHENADVHEVPQLLVGEDEDPLHEDDLPRLDPLRHVGAAVGAKVVRRNVHRFAGLELKNMLEETIRVEGIGVVEVVLVALLETEMPQVLVVVVVVDVGDTVEFQALTNGLRQGGLSRSRATRDSNHQRLMGTVGMLQVSQQISLLHLHEVCVRIDALQARPTA
mmetsp:Transcript_34019/g.57119  ORF Transcript_34019/g.57119 Transcript_34019/m.57119 type:complete len:211 (-) Transcript_34019:397-1029(-)